MYILTVTVPLAALHLKYTQQCLVGSLTAKHSISAVKVIALRVVYTLRDILYKTNRKERIRNVTIRQQIGLEETIIKETEQNQLTCYGHVQRMAEGRLPKIELKWIPKQKSARGIPKES